MPSSPAAPRVLTAQERKRRLLEERRSRTTASAAQRQQQQSADGGGSSNDGGKRRRTSDRPVPVNDDDETQDERGMGLTGHGAERNAVKDTNERGGSKRSGRSRIAPTSLFGAVMSRSQSQQNGTCSGGSGTNNSDLATTPNNSGGSRKLYHDPTSESTTATEHSVDLLAPSGPQIAEGAAAGNNYSNLQEGQDDGRSNFVVEATRFAPGLSSQSSCSGDGSNIGSKIAYSPAQTPTRRRRTHLDDNDNSNSNSNLSTGSNNSHPGNSRRRQRGLFDTPDAGSRGSRTHRPSPGGYGMMEMLMDVTHGSPFKGSRRGTSGSGSGSGPQKGEESGAYSDEEDDYQREEEEEDKPMWQQVRLNLPTSLARRLEGEDCEDEADGAIPETQQAMDMPTQPPPASSPLPSSGTSLSQQQQRDWNGGRGMNVGIIDWSLNRRLRLDCHPGATLPGGEGNYRIDRLATQIFLSGSDGGNFQGDESVAGSDSMSGEAVQVAAQWRAAQMYWRHPAVYPLPSPLLEDSYVGGASASAMRPSMGPPPPRKSLRFAATTGAFSTTARVSPEEEAAALRRAVTQIHEQRHAHHRPMGFGSRGSAPSSSVLALMADPAEFRRRRDAEWRDAFRSLFYAWLERVDCLRLDCTEASNSGGDSFISSSLDQMTRCYFYSVSSDCTILFRCRFVSGGKIEPIIVISSTTAEFRSKLRDMGVTLHIFEESNEMNTVFSESVFDAKPESKASKHEQDEAKKVHEELEALRQATAHGQTAGAEISVSIKKDKKANHDHWVDSQIVRPLFVKGDDDCMAFFEFFLNTNGRFDSSKTDVPLLLHRAFGPTTNFSIDCLQESSRRDVAFFQLKEQKQQENNIESEADQQHYPQIQFDGPLMPCAARDLLYASAIHCALDRIQKLKYQNMEGGMEELGPCYAVCTMSPQESVADDATMTSKQPSRTTKKATNRMAYLMKQTGNATSGLFNADTEILAISGSYGMEERNEYQISTCASNEVVHMLIWNPDSDHGPSAVAYRTAGVSRFPGS